MNKQKINKLLVNIKAAEEKLYPKTDKMRKISLRQVMILFFLSTVSGTLRVMTPGSKSMGILSKSSWLSPFIALIPILILIFVLKKITEHNTEKSLAQIIEMVFGKIIGKTILFLFLIHVLFLTSYFLKNFGEKFVLSIFPNVSPLFFMIALLIFSLFAVRKNIEFFARFSEFTFIIVSLVFIITFFVVLFNINPKNLYPVTYYDIKSIIKSSLPLISLWSLFTFSFFLGDNINYSGKRLNVNNKTQISLNFKKTAVKFMIITASFNFFALISLIGIFNAETAVNISMPYFMIFKSIKTIGFVQSFETFFIILWVFTDFIMIVYYMFIMSKIFKTTFLINEKNIKLFMSLLAFIIFALTFIIDKFNDFYILSYSSIIFGFILPFLILALGKIRKVL